MRRQSVLVIVLAAALVVAYLRDSPAPPRTRASARP